MEYIVCILGGIVVGAAAAYAFFHLTGRNLISRARQESEQLRESAQTQARNQAKEIELSARQEQIRIKEAFDKDVAQSRHDLKSEEQRLSRREDLLDKQLSTLGIKEKHLDGQEEKLERRAKGIETRESQLEAMHKEERERLLQITGMTSEQAREMLLRRVEDECRQEAGALIQSITEKATEEAKDKSRNIILQAIQRYAAEQTANHTVSSVVIPSDDMKGRVIGREGRNIRAFEKATGVDVIIDDTPGVVVVSCFDPVRREIARISLERLVLDGRIHPARIEEVVGLVGTEMDDELVRLGKEAAQEANLPNLAKPILPLLGRLHYRTSYGQNVLKHSLEVAYLSQTIADELGLDGNIARRAGLLHDIGKAMDHETEGGHPQIGMEFLKRFSESEAVLNACLAHHGDCPATTPYTPIVMAADAISASRPGARRESLERYIRRLQDLEDVALGFDGVRQAYAIQAGREVRVIVDAKMVDDKVSSKICRDIARKIQDDMTYPGEIKVTLIREVRTVEYAR